MKKRALRRTRMVTAMDESSGGSGASGCLVSGGGRCIVCLEVVATAAADEGLRGERWEWPGRRVGGGEVGMLWGEMST